MSRFLIILVLCAAALLSIWDFQSPAAAEGKSEPEDRVAQARELREEKLRKRCSDKNLTYPPRELFLRALKREQTLEVWAGNEGGKTLQLLVTYPLTAFSGVLGPKRREGDRQIPEGVYHIDRFNPRSAFHMSIGLNNPNSAERRFADHKKPGGDIFIHGRAASVGCLAIGDEAIEELYVLATDVSEIAQHPIPVHIFPARMNEPEWKPSETTEAEENPALTAFWENLRPIYARFEETRIPPEVKVEADGRYQLKGDKPR
jgi:murein L,D-transpeptidase YafK